MALIELEDRTAAALRAQAQARNLPLDMFLKQLAEAGTSMTVAQTLPPEEFDRLIDELASHSPVLPPLSRADIYSDHD